MTTISMTDLIRAETLRLTSTRLWLYGLAAALLTGGGLVGLLGLIGPENSEPPLPPLSDPAGVSAVLSLPGLTLFVPALIGALAITGDFRNRTVVPTFLAEPRRGRVLVAKLVTFTWYGLQYGLVSAGSALGALVLSSVATATPLGLPMPTVVGRLLGLAIAMAGHCLIGVAIGALVRKSLVAAGIVLGYFYLVENLLLIIPRINVIHPFLPAGATAALTGSTFLQEAIESQLGTATAPVLSATLGAVVLACYAAAAALVAVAVPLRRDV